jgi:hypothetical protein
MERIAFINGETFYYWSTLILAIAAVAAMALYASLYVKKGGNVLALTSSIMLSTVLGIPMARFLHWYCRAASYESLQTAMTDYTVGGYALMGGYADFVRSFAREHGLALCDYHKAMTRAMQTEILFDPDRVHPTQNGHAVMAKEFLSMLGIDYEPLKTFSDDIEEWYDVTQTLRNIITTEFLMIPGYANMNDDERSAKISEYYENMKNGSYAPGPYFERLVLAYVKDKPSWSEYVDFVKKFMKRRGSS